MEQIIIRRIDDLGRIVIPRIVREKAGIEIGDPFNVFFDPITNTIVVKPYIDNEKKEA